MAYSPIALVAPNYRDYKNEWLKAYEPGTTTPKIIALDSGATITVAKVQLNADGFLKSAGGTLVIPYIEDSYDLWLFPTEAEADENNTVNAEKLADNINALNESVINDLSLPYIFDTVAEYKDFATAFPVGKVIVTNEFKQGYAGGARYVVVAGVDSSNEANVIASSLTGQSIDLIAHGSVQDVRQWGVIPDGVLPDGSKNPSPTDNKANIDVVCEYMKDKVYPEFQGGAIRFIGGPTACYSTSGDHSLPECGVIGENVKIRPLSNPNRVFYLDTTHTTNTRRFVKNFKVSGFTVYSDRGFGTPTVTTDLNYFLEMVGGWVIRSEFSNLDTDPGVAMRAMIHWDLIHRNIGTGITEVGVPDGNLFENVSCQFTENTSFCIAFSGDELGSGSRSGSAIFRNIYNSIVNGYGFVTRAAGGTDFGTIRLDDVNLGRPEFDEIYGPTHALRMFGISKISNGTFTTVYSEMVRDLTPDFETMFRGSDTSSMVNCTFNYLQMYAENASLQASPRYFFGIKVDNCNFHYFTTVTNSVSTNPTNADLINLGVSSNDNKLHQLPVFEGVVAEPSPAWIQQRISINSTSKVLFADRSSSLQNPTTTTIGGTGEIVLLSIPNGQAQLALDWLTQLRVSANAGSSMTCNVILKGSGITNTRSGPSVTLGASESTVLTQLVVSDATDLPTPTSSGFSTCNAAITQTALGTNQQGSTASSDLDLQQESGEYSVVLNVTATSGNTFVVPMINDIGMARGWINWI
jgi:hypothetical protein